MLDQDFKQGFQRLTPKEQAELTAILERQAQIKDNQTSTVVGFVDPEKGFTHSLRKDAAGKWKRTQAEPDMYLPAKMERVLTSKKRFIVIMGGRGSGKSLSAADICLIEARDNLTKTFCLREYQSSIRTSVHSLLKEEVARLEFNEFEVQQSTISVKGHDAFEFAGISRNVESVKSSHGFKRYLIEESQFISKDSLKVLTPTARNKPNKGLPGDTGAEMIPAGVSLIFVVNPGSSEDPFSQRFINPYLESLDRDGYFEDDLHLIVRMNYEDNPWFHESGLEEERQWDYEHLPRALYDHIWLGKFNDSVDNSLIMAEWFDACVDAHNKIGFAPAGARIAAHDPSDGGEDTKGYAMRHGSVVLDVQEKLEGNVNEGGHWAAQIAIDQKVDHFEWDGDGMGAGLAEQMGSDFEGKKVDLAMFKGSESPDYPTATYLPAIKSPVKDQQSNEDVFKNKRAQYYFALRDRILRTYRAVIHGEYHDPDTLISFSSDMPLLSKLRAELCRIPVKPNSNGLNELYTKPDMKRKFKIASPNLGDAVMMSMRYVAPLQRQPHIPRPIRPMRTR